MVESPNVEYVDLFKRIAVFTNTFHQRPVGTGERARSSKGHLGKKVYWTSTNTLTNQLFENQTSQNFVSRKLWNSELSTQWLSRPISNFPDFTKFKPCLGQTGPPSVEIVWPMTNELTFPVTLNSVIFSCCSVFHFINWMEHIIEYIDL